MRHSANFDELTCSDALKAPARCSPLPGRRRRPAAGSRRSQEARDRRTNEGAIVPIFDSRQKARSTAIVAGATAILAALIAAGSALLVQRFGLGVILAPVPILTIALLTYLGHRAQVTATRSRIEDLMRIHLETIEALTLAIDAKDPHSHGHVRRVQAFALELARRMNVPRAEVEAILTAALLHDIGKLAIPDYLLNKPGKLSDMEYQKVKVHPKVAIDILANVEFAYPVLPIIRHHHERWDGSGYPDGLRSEAIPHGARILADG